MALIENVSASIIAKAPVSSSFHQISLRSFSRRATNSLPSAYTNVSGIKSNDKLVTENRLYPRGIPFYFALMK